MEEDSPCTNFNIDEVPISKDEYRIILFLTDDCNHVLNQGLCITLDELHKLTPPYMLGDVEIDTTSYLSLFKVGHHIYKAIRRNRENFYTLEPLKKDIEKKFYDGELLDGDILQCDRIFKEAKRLSQGSYGAVSLYPHQQIVTKKSFDWPKKELIPGDIIKEIAAYRIIEKTKCSPQLLNIDFKNYQLHLTAATSSLRHRHFQGIRTTEKKSIFLDIIKCMYVIAKQGIIHCDIKPQNLVYLQTPTRKIGQVIDYGLMEIDRSKNQTRDKNLNIQTLWYRAPEIVIGYPYYDYKIDIWSLGCSLFEILRNKVLFEASGVIDLAHKLVFFIEGDKEVQHMNASVVSGRLQDLITSNTNYIKIKNTLKKLFLNPLFLNPDHNENLIDLLSKMLEYNPKKRIDYLGIINHPYFSIITSSNVPEPYPYELSSKNFKIDLDRGYSKDLTLKMRAKVIEWLLEFSKESQLCPDVFFLSISLIDAYLTRDNSIDRTKFQLLGGSCLAIANLLFYGSVDLQHYVYMSADGFTEKQFINMIHKIVKTLDGNILLVNPFTYIQQMVDYQYPNKIISKKYPDYVRNTHMGITLLYVSGLVYKDEPQTLAQKIIDLDEDLTSEMNKEFIKYELKEIVKRIVNLFFK
jgi:serine/threonine protein kinase